MDFKKEYELLIDILRYPSKMIKKNKKLTASEGLKYVAFGAIANSILLSLMGLLTGTGGWSIIFLPLAILFVLIGAALFWAVGGTIYWIIIAVLGCKKDLGNFLGVSGLINGAIYLIIWIPVIGQLFGFFYGIYLYYIMLTKAMGMSKGRAIIAILIPILLIILFVITLITLLITLFGIAMLTSLSETAISKI